MSRVGRKPIPIPSGVTVEVAGASVTVKGSNGTLVQPFNPDLTVRVEDGNVLVERPDDRRDHRALHGLTRALIANMMVGVSQGFTKSLEIVGYRCQQTGTGVTLQVGYSHNLEMKPLEGVQIEVEGNNRIHIRGADKQAVGQVAALIRAVRPPDAYKGKGIRYTGEVVRLKAGKSAGRG
ncbi:MAG: 50S ribosomal protein L6 [Chloroflexi bacterium]|nr:50S ribosomal protein L6 [Chloroflexota bacterium]